MVPKVHWLSLDLGPIIDVSQGVDVGFIVNLLDLSNLLGVVGSRVNFEDSLADSSRISVEYGCNALIQILVSAQEEISLLNEVEDA